MIETAIPISRLANLKSMGASASKDDTLSPGSGGSYKFKAKDLRAPIFGKSVPEKVDFKANRKYCSDEIVKSWFKILHSDRSGDITFEEYRKSALGSQFSDDIARENFARMDLDGNNVIDFEELKTYHEKVGLPDLDISPADT
jgi:hypothetical protein